MPSSRCPHTASTQRPRNPQAAATPSHAALTPLHATAPPPSPPIKKPLPPLRLTQRLQTATTPPPRNTTVTQQAAERRPYAALAPLHASALCPPPPPQLCLPQLGYIPTPLQRRRNAALTPLNALAALMLPSCCPRSALTSPSRSCTQFVCTGKKCVRVCGVKKALRTA